MAVMFTLRDSIAEFKWAVAFQVLLIICDFVLSFYKAKIHRSCMRIVVVKHHER